MKIRVYNKIVNGVFDVTIHTEDWSCNDQDLMRKYGEPEINLGGTFILTDSETEEPLKVTLDDFFVRVMSETPFNRKFDTRDFGGLEDFSEGLKKAKSIAQLWTSTIEDRIVEQLRLLRDKDTTYTTETVTEF